MVLLDKNDSVIESGQNTVVTIGNFDGVHLGHQKLIDECLRIAKNQNLKTVVLSFYPHPRKVLNNDFEFNTVLTQGEKVDFLVNAGIDYFRKKPIDLEFLNYSPEEFVEKILVKELSAKVVVVGKDHRLGAKRGADIYALTEICKKHGIETIGVDLRLDDGEKISSTTIRDAIAKGNFEKVTKLLGRNYSITGVVVSGKRLGRTIGVPTANVFPENEKLLPPNGVYVSKIKINGEIFNSVSNIGWNPTIKSAQIVVETNILDFDREIYGEVITVELLKFVRGEVKFDSVECLKTQLYKDIAIARKYFEEHNM